jgi:CRP-like cAMP-binding protein
MQFEKGRQVIKLGQQISSLFLVYDGEVKLTSCLAIQIGILGRGEFFNENCMEPSEYNVEVSSETAAIMQIKREVY